MSIKIGFIGAGNMGGALARACAQSVFNEKLLLSDGYAPVAEKQQPEHQYDIDGKGRPIEVSFHKNHHAYSITAAIRRQSIGECIMSTNKA